jgi:hypothetical protein
MGARSSARNAVGMGNPEVTVGETRMNGRVDRSRAELAGGRQILVPRKAEWWMGRKMCAGPRCTLRAQVGTPYRCRMAVVRRSHATDPRTNLGRRNALRLSTVSASSASCVPDTPFHFDCVAYRVAARPKTLTICALIDLNIHRVQPAAFTSSPDTR